MNPDTTAQTRSPATCVVLVHAERSVDDVLRAGPEGRPWQVSRHHDPVMAMTELCLRRRTVDPEAEGSDMPALVVVDPGDWPEWPAMQDALQRHLPEIALLEHRDGSVYVIATPPAATVRRNGPPPLPLPDNGEATAPSDITRDELDMLLQNSAGRDG